MEMESNITTHSKEEIIQDQSLSSKEYKRMLLARKLRFKLKTENIKIRDFAEKLGKSSSEVSRWLSGNHNFTIDTLFDIENQLGVTLIDIDLPTKDVTNGSVVFEVSVKKSKQAGADEDLIQLWEDYQKSLSH